MGVKETTVSVALLHFILFRSIYTIETIDQQLPV